MCNPLVRGAGGGQAGVQARAEDLPTSSLNSNIPHSGTAFHAESGTILASAYVLYVLSVLHSSSLTVGPLFLLLTPCLPGSPFGSWKAFLYLLVLLCLANRTSLIQRCIVPVVGFVRTLSRPDLACITGESAAHL